MSNTGIVTEKGEVFLNLETINAYIKETSSMCYWWNGERCLEEFTKFFNKCATEVKLSVPVAPALNAEPLAA